MAKLTIDQLKKLVALVGVPAVEVVEKEDESDYNEDELLSEIDKSRSEILRPQITEELNKTANDAATARISGMISSMISQLTGMKRSELAELKTDRERVEKGLQFYNSKMDQSTEELRKEMEDMMTAHNLALESERTKRKEIEDTWKAKYTDREINEMIISEFGKLPLPKDTDRMAAAKLYANFLRDQYHLHFDEEKKTLSLRDKNNTDLPVYNDAKNKTIGVMDKAEEYFKPLGLWQTSTKNINPADEMRNRRGAQSHPNTEEPKNVMKNPVQDKTQAMLAYMDAQQLKE